MKKYILFAIIPFLTACYEGYDSMACYKSVQEKYPGSTARMIPNEKYKFVVKTANGDILWVETMNPHDTDITAVYQLFP